MTWRIVSVVPSPTRHTWRTVTAVRGEGRNRQIIKAEVQETLVDSFDPATYWNAR